MTFKMTWLADVLRAAGCKVTETDGWQSRGVAEMGTVAGVLCHHTAGALTGNAPSLALVEHGRQDLRGPLSHLLLARDGTFYVLAAGRCNHAGAGSWQGVVTGNSSFIGIEAENAGTAADPWPADQVEAYARGAAALLKHIGAFPLMCAGHKEYALPRGRKIDPSFDMGDFRAKVTRYMQSSTPGIDGPVAQTDAAHVMLKRGDHGADVMLLQRLLGFTGAAMDADFGQLTENAVKVVQRAHGLTDDGLVGPKTWAILLK